MDCLAELIGLRGGCEDQSSNSTYYLDTQVTHHELTKYVDQNDVYRNTTAKLFTSLREDAARVVLNEINSHMAQSYIAKTVVKSTFLGDTNTTLTSSPASAVLKGVRLEQYTEYPSYAYRVNRIGFVGDYTGTVTVLYYDGITGEQLASDTISAVADTRVEKDVNRLFRNEVLTIVYDATGIDGFKTTINGLGGGCYTCRNANANKVNGYCYGQGLTATIGSPLSPTYINDMGGLTVSFSIECDHNSWLCQIKEQLGMSLLYKTAELVMQYGLTSDRENTATVRDSEQMKERQMMYRELFDESMTRAMKGITLPDNPKCFRCKRRNKIAVQIP